LSPVVERRRPIQRERSVVQEQRIVRHRDQHAVDHRGGTRQAVEIAGFIRGLDLATRGVRPLCGAGELLTPHDARNDDRQRGRRDQGMTVHRFSFSHVMVPAEVDRALEQARYQVAA
jgi:hypothetical protein